MKELQKIAIPSNYSQELCAIEQLKGWEDLGRQLVRKCGCLPLPIVVIGGILRQEKTQSDWEKVCKNIDSYLLRGKGVEENKNVKQVLDLSYNLLPYNLKPCFLYLGCFPEDQMISTDHLYLIWMAEGMISSEDRGRGETLRDVAQRYLSELANRCMLQPEINEDSTYNTFSSCRLHDLMRDLCLSKAKEEGFLRVFDSDQMGRQDASSVKRLAFSMNIKVEDCQLHHYQNLRCLLFLNRSWKELGIYSSMLNSLKTSIINFGMFNPLKFSIINFGMFNSLKILMFEGCEFENGQLPKGIENLILLKHLSIAVLSLDKLPKSVCKLPYLQSLDLRRANSIILPNLICNLKRLKYLVLPSTSVIRGGKLELEGMNELEILFGFNSSIHDTFGLIKLPKLRVFDADIYDEGSLVMIVDHILNHQGRFQETKFNINEECNMMNGGSTLVRKILMCRSLTTLEILCGLNKLPSYERQLGMNLIKLVLENGYISEDPTEMLEKLPRLKILHLNRNSFIGEKMVCRANGFSQLRQLNLWNLPNLVEWRVDEKAMPNLSELWIRGCIKLEMIPKGLKFIITLKDLCIEYMPEEFMNRVREEGKDYDKIKHIQRVHGGLVEKIKISYMAYTAARRYIDGVNSSNFKVPPNENDE